MKTVTIRLPEDLYAVIAKLADQDQRSITKQIVYLCQRGLNGLALETGEKAALLSNR